jgi:hypothetical protein
VLDIGGGIGDYTLFAACAAPHGKVFAFEPFPGSFALLQENLAANHAGPVQAFAEAIWSQAGARRLRLVRASSSCSADDLDGAPTKVGRYQCVHSMACLPAGDFRCDSEDRLRGAEYPICSIPRRCARACPAHRDGIPRQPGQYTCNMREFLA